MKDVLPGIGFMLLLLAIAFGYALIFKPTNQRKKQGFVYEYYIDKNNISKDSRYIITSIDTTYGEEGMPNRIEVRLSNQ